MREAYSISRIDNENVKIDKIYKWRLVTLAKVENIKMIGYCSFISSLKLP